MRRWFVFAFLVLFTSVLWAQGLPEPDCKSLRLDHLAGVDAEKPYWVDATPIFHDMAQAALKKFVPKVGKPKKEGIPIGGVETFWTMNVATSQFERVSAVLKRIGRHCYLYVEEGWTLDESILDSLLSEYDGKIYPTCTTTFGSEPKPGVDGDERVTLLLLDIKDGWEPGKGYVGGYFFPLNQFSVKDFPQSNEREMIYIDIHPSDPKNPFFMGVVAHEFQHLIHFNQDPRETKWVNEGGSQYSFYACGYGHPNQIMSYTLADDHTVTNWQNTIEDYGAVYLFFYYLYNKYPSPGLPLSLAVTSNRAQGIDGINDALNETGIGTDFESVFHNWAVANIIARPSAGAGFWGYDATLPVKVISRTVDPRTDNFPMSQKVKTWSNDYFQVISNPFWTPADPTIADVLEVYLPSKGFVIWSVDEGIAPPEALWPPNTRAYIPGKNVITRIDNEPFAFTIGPFIETPVNKVNISLFNNDYVSFEHAQINIATATAQITPLRGDLNIAFKGKKTILGPKEGLKVRIALEGTGCDLADLELDKDWNGNHTVKNIGGKVKRVSLIVGNSAKKDIDYEVAFSLEPSMEFSDNLAAIERAHELLNRIRPLLTSGRSNLESLYVSASEQLESLIRHAADELDIDGSAEAAGNIEKFAPVAGNPAFRSLLTLLAQKEHFKYAHGEITPAGEAVKNAVDAIRAKSGNDLSGSETSGAGAELRDDDSDTSHTNIIYLTNKKQEYIHALTHLKIDPKFLEGQILSMYKILQLSLNLPNIPLPDGLAIVNYCEDAAQSYVDRLRIEGATLQEKESLRRLTIFEDLTERVYNENLTMAEDFGFCLYELGRLIMTGRATLLSISTGLANVPIVGTLTKKVTKLILGKSLGVVSRIVNLVSAKLSPVYGMIVPVVVHIGGSIAAKLLDAPVDGDNEWLKPWAAKTASKYVFASLPKIGYVARTQPYVDAGVAQALKNDFTLTTEEAVKAVLDDGDQDAFKSVFESFAYDIAKKHSLINKEVEIAKIAKGIAQIAAFATLVDPTNVSKVVAILSGVVSGGALTHGMITSVEQFTKARDVLDAGLIKSFHPEREPAATTDKLVKHSVELGKIAGSLKLLGTYKYDYRSLVDKVKKAHAEEDLKTLTGAISELVAFEEAFESLERLSAMSCEATLAATSREEDLAGIMNQGIKSDFSRIQLLSSLLPAANGEKPSQDITAQADAAAESLDEYIMRMSEILTAKPKMDIAPKTGITQLEIERRTEGWEISAVVTLISPEPAVVDFTLFGAEDTLVERAPKPQLIQPWDSVRVEWYLKGNQSKAGRPVSVAVHSQNHLSGFMMDVLP